MDRISQLSPIARRATKGLPLTIILSYAFDYGIIIVLAVIYAALDKWIQPFRRRFSLTDTTIQFPMAIHERIPIATALVISGLFPIILMAFYTLVIDGIFSHRKRPGTRPYTWKDRLWQLNCAILGLLLAQGAAFCITGTLKNMVGRPRPDFISRCLPVLNSANQAGFGLSTSEICTQTDEAIMQDGFRSFPSGHSSSSFAGLWYLSLWLAAKLHLLDQRGEVWRTVIVIIPTMAAACIAVSRTMDYRHHATDVLFGSALGILCAWGAYRQYFPPLSHSWEKGRAYPVRTWGVPSQRPEDRYSDYAASKIPVITRTPSVGPLGDGASEFQYGHQYPERQDEAYNVEPLRQRPPIRTIREGSVDGFEGVSMTPVGLAESTDYDLTKMPAGRENFLSPVQLHQLPRPASNAFRAQVSANHTARAASPTTPDEMDIGSRRSSIPSPARVR